jgi:ABC-type polysaccharide/polyol phosphate transport system ATPase subunit
MTTPTNAPAVELEDVSKHFYHYAHRSDSMQEAVLRLVRGLPVHERRSEFHLHQVSLTIAPGESVGIIGGNGSGKSSLLRLMAGIYPPTTGRVVTRGRVVPVIELGATFQPDLTGIENLELYGVALGVPRAEVLSRAAEYLAFAEVEDHRDVPLKYYSSGMRTRLAFAIAVKSRPDILLLDEVLAVGDERFRARCLATVRTFHQQGGTLVLASHDLDGLPQVVDRCLWIERGALRADGDAAGIIRSYREQSN